MKDFKDLNDFWTEHLAKYERYGRRDADKGVFHPPHVSTDEDPQDIDENAAYKRGFDKRRQELGDKFRWAYSNKFRCA